jgi:hypothetical protein
MSDCFIDPNQLLHHHDSAIGILIYTAAEQVKNQITLKTKIKFIELQKNFRKLITQALYFLLQCPQRYLEERFQLYQYYKTILNYSL